jgi:hypothetical protein
MVRPVRLLGKVQREFAKTLIDGADAGWIMTLKEPNRTNDQNARFWAMLTDLSEQKPEGVEETPAGWKFLVMNAAGHECQFMMGLNKRPFATGFRSSHLTVSEMRDLMDWMDAYGAEHGVVWTEPNPYEEAHSAR